MLSFCLSSKQTQQIMRIELKHIYNYRYMTFSFFFYKA